MLFCTYLIIHDILELVWNEITQNKHWKAPKHNWFDSEWKKLWIQQILKIPAKRIEMRNIHAQVTILRQVLNLILWTVAVQLEALAATPFFIYKLDLQISYKVCVCLIWCAVYCRLLNCQKPMLYHFCT